MSGKNIRIDTSEFQSFIKRLRSAAKGDFKRELEVFIDGLGTEFLRIIQDEIIRLKVVDSRTLLSSFSKGGKDNVFEIKSGSLTLEVGTNVKYASYVNDGHWLNPKGVSVRWVPGVWSKNRFIYDPNSSSGMLLKQKFIPGTRYFDNAVDIMERMMPTILERKTEQWLKKYFSDFV